MKWSEYYIPTLREDPKDSEVVSHRLLTRAGFIRKLSSGLYDILPLGNLTLKKIENIIREEMNNAGAIEVILPLVTPSELWKETGRWSEYGKELLRFRDRSDREFCFAPTHEEVIVDLVRRDLRSYKQLPLILYQIGVKFRDEIRPRFGLMRAREFVMKDAYSFDRDEKSAEISYSKMFEAYKRIFKRCGLSFEPVEAETGAIGGHFSHEFMVLADTGEEEILFCPKCGYAANAERAERAEEGKRREEKILPLQKVHTPGKRTVQEISEFLNVEPSRLLKSLIYKVDEKYFLMAVVSGEREINENKLMRALSAGKVSLALSEEIEALTGAPVGYAGPVGLGDKLRIICDFSVREIQNGVTGANEEDFHYVNVNPERDFSPSAYFDIAFARAGDLCPRCKEERLQSKRGIEVGHTFKLGKKYSSPMRCVYIDENGKEQEVYMGCYGIGVGRTMAAAVEQNHDAKGIIWPKNIAPFEASIIIVNISDHVQKKEGFRIYEELRSKGVSIILDERDERPGIKFNDSDLIGFPYQIIIGNRVKEGYGEVKIRRTGEIIKFSLNDLSGLIKILREL